MQTTTANSIPLYENRWVALGLLCAAQFMVIMDTSIIGVALPAIKTDLGYSQSGLQWIFNAYVILFGSILLLGGRLADLFGSRKIFMWGFVILSTASLLAGMAWSPAALNIARALQGMGSALIAPASMTLLMTTFTDPKELGKAFGFWGAAAAAGGSAGVFLGGVITEWMSWPWVFYINIPVGIVVLLLSPRYLQGAARIHGKIDWLGSLLVTASLMLLVYSIVAAESAGWFSLQTTGLIALSIFLFVMFIQTQKRSSFPLVPLSVFKVFNLAAGNIAMALMAAAWIPLWFFLNLYLQQILRLNAFYSGLALLPMTITIMIVMVGLTGKLVARYGFRNLLIAGMFCLMASLILFSFVPENGSYWVNVLPGSLLGALGMSLAYIPGTMAAMSGAKPEETGLASGIVNTSYQIGSALGLAIIAVIAATVTRSSMTGETMNATALNGGFRAAFMSASIISALGLIISVIKIKSPGGK